MDPLLSEIAKRKQNSTGQKWVRRGDLELERERKYLEDQAERKKLKPNPKPIPLILTSESSAPVPVSKPQVEEPVSKESVVQRLRNIGEPARFFAETVDQQYARLKSAERKLAEDGNTGARPSILNYQSRVKVYWDDFLEAGEGLEDVEAIYHTSSFLEDAKDWDAFEDRGEVYHKHKEHPIKLEALQLAYGTKVAFVYRWCKELINVWQEEISDLATNNPDAFKEQNKKLKETKQSLRSLIQLLKSQEVKEDVVTAFFRVTRLCQIRSYVKAHDQYLALASGGVPWVIEKPDLKHRGGLITSKSHIGNVGEESYRMFVQSFKRLMSMCQRRYPNAPSKEVLA